MKRFRRLRVFQVADPMGTVYAAFLSENAAWQCVATMYPFAAVTMTRRWRSL